MCIRDRFNTFWKNAVGLNYDKAKIYHYYGNFKDKFYDMDWGISHSAFTSEPFGYGIFEAVDRGKLPILHSTWCKDFEYPYRVSSKKEFINGSWLNKSVHIDLVGAHTKQMAELDPYGFSLGEIYVDDINGREISKNSWRSQLGYVSQETIIFDDSIANNICMWSGDYKNDKKLLSDIREAAKQANILDFIDSLEDGFDSMVGDRGILLSGGQRQRLFVARELFRKPNSVSYTHLTLPTNREV